MAVILETSLGDITVDLYTDERPRTCFNFLKLCKVKYYNFVLFFSVQRNLCVQSGDPTGTGRGGESIYSQLYGEQARFFEMEKTPKLKHKKTGTLSMVNNGSDMHASQFLITTAENLDYLDGKHTVFGEVSEGFDILSKINETFCDDDNRPYRDIRMFHTVVIDDPYPDPPALTLPSRSPSPCARETLDIIRIGVDEKIDEMEGMSKEQIEAIIQDKEAKANAQILEMVGDLPDAEMAPPDNVLFVCKLNPVTTSDDLEIIFSRFGNIISCEVIRDQLNGESLQYAFIEFEKPEDCERAYFKMDNVLIDDRRIHVDFSQSVAKVKWNEYSKQKRGKAEKPHSSGVKHSNYSSKSGQSSDKDYSKSSRDKDRPRYYEHVSNSSTSRRRSPKEDTKHRSYDRHRRSRSRSRSPKHKHRHETDRHRSHRKY